MLQVIVRARQCIIGDPYVILDDIHDLSPVALPILRSLQEVRASCQPTRRPSGMPQPLSCGIHLFDTHRLTAATSAGAAGRSRSCSDSMRQGAYLTAGCLGC